MFTNKFIYKFSAIIIVSAGFNEQVKKD